LQPIDTGPATTEDQADHMASNTAKRVSGGDTHVAEPPQHLKPSREVGWIFKDGEVVAIERRECEARHGEDVR
jgi:hypothetical protein